MQSVQQQTPASDAKITDAVITALSGEGDGYMYVLDIDGTFAFWTAEIHETSACERTVFNVSSQKLTAENPYITGGSTITDLKA